MRACWMSELKAQVQLSNTILDLQVKACLTRASGPDLHDFMKAAKEECLLGVAEGGGVHVLDDDSLEVELRR